MQSIPLIQYIERAQLAFANRYGFSAEKLHASPAFERVLHRWASFQQEFIGKITYEGAEINGLEILQSTKRSTPHVEFWLSATRGDTVHSIHVRLSPQEVGAHKAMTNDVIHLATPEESYDTL